MTQQTATPTDVDAAALELEPLPLPYLPGAAIFDCDGTLADTMPIHYRAWRETLDSLGAAHVFPEEQFYAWGGVTAAEIVARLNARHGLTLAVEETAHLKEETYRRLMPELRAIPSVVAEARRFREAGIPLAVASGGRRDLVEQTLRILGVRDWFGAVVGSEDVQHGKPDPEVFLTAANGIGAVPADCVVYEDADAGILAGQRAGMRVVDIRPYLPPR
jgi:haloacid dehalogenase superfamily, subfamily IA, variant 3 with third motif having DD or ED